MTEQIKKVSDYLYKKYKKQELNVKEISSEILYGTMNVYKMIADGRLESKHINDVSKYIVEGCE